MPRTPSLFRLKHMEKPRSSDVTLKAHDEDLSEATWLQRVGVSSLFQKNLVLTHTHTDYDEGFPHMGPTPFYCVHA